MDTKLLDRMGPAELRAYVEFLLWHYRVIDGFWFLFVQDASISPRQRESTSGSGTRPPNWPPGIL